MKVYFIRHGETVGNVEKFHQGWGDVPLTEKGIKQAQRAKKMITKKEYDRVFCSDILRTRQTCEIIFGNDPRIEYDGRLREINNDVIAGKKREDLFPIYGEKYTEGCRHLEYAYLGGESAQSMLDRTADFLRELEGDKTSKRIAVVTHGGTIHAFLANILQMPLYSPLIKIENCSVTVAEYKNGFWTLCHLNNKTEL